MKITVFNGSPKGEASNTNVLVSAFLKGAEGAGADVENLFLADKIINHCKACSYCMTSGGKCSISDDMEGLLAKYVETDILVLASPLYMENISGMLKVFLDRTFSITNPHFEMDDSGEYRAGKSAFFKDKKPPKLVVISNCGFPQRSNFQVVSHLMKRFARNFHMDLIGEIHVPQGGLLTAGVKELEPVINGYLELLQKAGQEIVTDMIIAKETQRMLESIFIPVDIYVREMNRFADMLLEQTEIK